VHPVVVVTKIRTQGYDTADLYAPRTRCQMTSLDPSPTILPTGEQWAIAHGRQQVIVTEVGATLRSYRVGDDEMLDGFGANEWSESGRGQVLAPWPNRLGDGRYEFGGIAAQAPLNEPELGNAIHGLVRWLPWRCEVLAQNVMVVRCTIWPTPAYPFLASLGLEYRLGREGLAVTATVRNEGSVALPFGLGSTPTCGSGPIGGHRHPARPARQRLVLDARSLPTGEARPVAARSSTSRRAGRSGPPSSTRPTRISSATETEWPGLRSPTRAASEPSTSGWTSSSAT